MAMRLVRFVIRCCSSVGRSRPGGADGSKCSASFKVLLLELEASGSSGSGRTACARPQFRVEHRSKSSQNHVKTT